MHTPYISGFHLTSIQSLSNRCVLISSWIQCSVTACESHGPGTFPDVMNVSSGMPARCVRKSTICTALVKSGLGFMGVFFILLLQPRLSHANIPLVEAGNGLITLTDDISSVHSCLWRTMAAISDGQAPLTRCSAGRQGLRNFRAMVRILGPALLIKPFLFVDLRRRSVVLKSY